MSTDTITSDFADRPEPDTTLSRLKSLKSMSESMKAGIERGEAKLFEIDPISQITPSNSRLILGSFLDHIAIMKTFFESQSIILDRVIEQIESEE